MCYASPGPRCSSHVQEQQKKVTQHYTDLKDQVKEMEELGWDDPSRPNVKSIVDNARTQMTALEARSNELHEQWKTTPKGISASKRLYDEAVRAGNEDFAEMAKEEVVTNYLKRREQLSAYDKAQKAKKAREAGHARFYKVMAEANAWKNSKPAETALASHVTVTSDGKAEVYLHGGVSPHDARQSYINAGYDPEGITFVPAEDPVPSLNEMPHLSFDEADSKILSGNIKLDEHNTFTASITSDGHNTGQAVRVVFAEGVSEPTVLRGPDATDNSKPAAVLLPGPKRKLTHEEALTIANAARSGGQVYLHDSNGKRLGVYDRRDMHGDLTRGKVPYSKKRPIQIDPDDARKMRLENAGGEIDIHEPVDDGRGRPRDRRQPILDFGRN